VLGASRGYCLRTGLFFASFSLLDGGATVSEPGARGPTGGCALNLASARGGEALRPVPVRAGDILLGDRVYVTPVGVL
jgi:hypothetical protein